MPNSKNRVKMRFSPHDLQGTLNLFIDSIDAPSITKKIDVFLASMHGSLFTYAQFIPESMLADQSLIGLAQAKQDSLVLSGFAPIYIDNVDVLKTLRRIRTISLRAVFSDTKLNYGDFE